MMIRDPVHGDIMLTNEETLVIDTKAMQRLRGIKQLGTAHLVYPGCLHSRFDHSLGTVQMAGRIIRSLRQNGYTVSEDDERVIRLAALVHDVTHIPFGHTFEDERKVFPRHDTPARIDRFLRETDLGDVLNHLRVTDDIAQMLINPNDWRSQIVSGTLDADLLDYAKRDSYFSGLSQRYDERLFAYFCIEDNKLAVNLTKNGRERHDARSEIIHLLRIRYILTERIYFHHTKVIAGAMISKALELVTEEGVEEKDLYDLDDAGLFRFLLESGHPVTGELIDRVSQRRLYKRAFLLETDDVLPHEQERLVTAYHENPEARRDLEDSIAKEAGVSPGQVIVYAPQRTALKEAEMPARFPGGVRQLNSRQGQYLDLDALSEQYARLWRFWVFAPEEQCDAVGRATADVLNLPAVTH